MIPETQALCLNPDFQHPHENHRDLIGIPCEYDFFGLRIMAPSGVYHPHQESTTRILKKAMPIVYGLRVLEIGAGAGALSICAEISGARQVVATDTSEAACAAMQCNAMLNGAHKLDVRCGNLFAPIAAHERFDLILFNPPLKDKVIEAKSELALCDPSGVLLHNFFMGAPRHVETSPSASILFLHSPSMSTPLPDQAFKMGRIEQVSTAWRGDDRIDTWLWNPFA